MGSPESRVPVFPLYGRKSVWVVVQPKPSKSKAHAHSSKKRHLLGRIPRPLDLGIKLRPLEVIVVTEHTEGMLGKELRSGRSFSGFAATTCVRQSRSLG